MNWVKEHVLELVLFMIVSAIATPAYFYKDNNQADLARMRRSTAMCNQIATQFIKLRCYDKITEDLISRCSGGDVESCRSDMSARYKALRPKPKFPLKLLVYLFLELILGIYFFYLKEKWSNW